MTLEQAFQLVAQVCSSYDRYTLQGSEQVKAALIILKAAVEKNEKPN